ncbi:helix-turn-helix domain-containing protein [Arcobacter cloacae]|uniref:Uncharacterized protein n=1 Tax=Arcobacter cloacae TaxID=1054034 RepID=A0A6M8N9I7_9BACT|nr:helix-turn-helix domain-containing protein [Arcobacter cloacae]QKF90728.1 helix-turn-helix domain-containing protein [Arcobacter cloacae]RXI41509.1 hypothetical protein CP963_06990 [Arcobacter cloacae]
MSVKAISLAFDTKLSGNVKLVLLALADCANDNMQCFPSYSHISKKASISISTTKRIVKKLESMQIIKKENRYKKGKRQQTSNIYTLTFGSSSLTPIKVQNDTTVVPQVTLPDSVIAMSYKSSSSLTTTQSSRESERDFLDFKNNIVKNFEGKIFGANNSNYIYSIINGLLCVNHQKIDTKKAFEEWHYLYRNQHIINPNLDNNINYINIGKRIEIENNFAKIVDIKDDFYVIEFNNQKKLVKIEDVRVV